MKVFLRTTILPYLAYFVIKFIYFTNKKVFHHPKLVDGEAYIFVAWHGDLVCQPMNYFKNRPNGTIKTLIAKVKMVKLSQESTLYLEVVQLEDLHLKVQLKH